MHFALHRQAFDVKQVFEQHRSDQDHAKTASGPLGLGADGVIADELTPPQEDKAPVVARAAEKSLFPSADLWLGAMVPKRWAKRAVTRNAIKRQIYTVSADFSPKHRDAAFVVRLRRDFSRRDYLSASSELLKQAVRTELLALLQEGALRA